MNWSPQQMNGVIICEVSVQDNRCTKPFEICSYFGSFLLPGTLSVVKTFGQVLRRDNALGQHWNKYRKVTSSSCISQKFLYGQLAVRGCECWTINMAIEARIGPFEMKSQRKILEVAYRFKKTWNWEGNTRVGGSTHSSRGHSSADIRL